MIEITEIINENSGTTDIVQQVVETIELVERGLTGPQGPQGTPGNDGLGTARFIYEQSFPSSEWIVNHNLGYYPIFSITDENGGSGILDVIHISKNQLRAYFNSPITGTISCI